MQVPLAAMSCLYGGFSAFCYQHHLGAICSFKLFCFCSLCLELYNLNNSLATRVLHFSLLLLFLVFRGFYQLLISNFMLFLFGQNLHSHYILYVPALPCHNLTCGHVDYIFHFRPATSGLFTFFLTCLRVFCFYLFIIYVRELEVV